MNGRLPTRSALPATAVVSVPLLLWFAAFRPGIMSADSLAIWTQATSGDWIDLHPPAYTALMWLSHLLIGSPSLLTVGQVIFLAAGLVAFTRSVLRFGAPRVLTLVVAGILVLSPMVGGFAVTLWKDVPYTAALLFVAARVVDIVGARLADREDEVRRAIWALVPWGMVVVALRQNGLIFMGCLVVGLLVAVRSHWRLLVVVLAASLGFFIALKVVVYPVIGVRPDRDQSLIAMFMHDVAAVAARDPGALRPGDLELMEDVAPVSRWVELYSGFGCSNANWEWDPSLRWEATEGRVGEYLGIWLHVTAEHPAVVARNRLCVGALAFRPDPGAPVMYTLSRGIDPNPLGLRTVPVVGALHDTGVDLIEFTDGQPAQDVLWRAPLWIYLTYVVLLVAAWRSRRWVVLTLAVPLAALQMTIFALNPAQDARYMFGGMLIAILLIPIAWTRIPGAAEPLDELASEASPDTSTEQNQHDRPIGAILADR